MEDNDRLTIITTKQFEAIEAYWAAQSKINPPTNDDSLVLWSPIGRQVVREITE